MSEDNYPKYNLQELSKRAKHCTNHHHACDCREYLWAVYVESWKKECEEKDRQLSQQAQEIDRLRAALKAVEEGK